MATYSLAMLLTWADCDAALLPLRLKRDEAAADVSALGFDLQTFADPAARQAEITRLNAKLSTGQAEVPTLPEGKDKRDLENDLATFIKRRNLLVNQSESRGADDKVVLEFRQEMARQTQAEAATLVTAIEAHRATLSA